jgi:hypothetical protein
MFRSVDFDLAVLAGGARKSRLDKCHLARALGFAKITP